MGRRWLFALLALGMLAAGCSLDVDDDEAGVSGDVPEDCTPVEIASSPEKIELLNALAQRFNASDEAGEGGCAFVRVFRSSSGVAADLLTRGWPDEATNGPRPVIWSPAAKSWGAIVNQRLAERDEEPITDPDAQPFMVTPLVIAMPRPMAEALGWPDTPIGYADLLALAADPNGWASKGHPEWGRFKLGKTNPNFSTSGLSSTIAQYYAATGKQVDLTLEDINRADVDQFARGVESAVVHYGDITMTFLNNLYRNDRAGVGLTYISAVAIEEKSIIDYNAGNPDGIVDPGEEPRKPRVPLVAIYPEEGTLFSDNPFFILDAEWVTERQKAAARAFQAFVQLPDNQRRVLEFGFRPGNPEVPVGAPITAANGVDPRQPRTTLGVPDPAVLVRLLDKWAEQRKAAKVMLVLDVSGSMGEEVTDGRTKLDLAKRAAIDALDQFKPEDEVALRIFSTDLGPQDHPDYVDLVGFGPISQQRERMALEIERLVPVAGTPLYSVAQGSYEDMKESHDGNRINAVVLLTDGRNEDDYDDLDETLARLRAGSEGQSASPVRLFTIAYGGDADKATLERLAQATNAAAYDASDPGSITKVLTAVISNF
ncbi:MAG TPA: extracellular solute-binding protein [Acidimicrobiales bacterium]|nr:extracellular solute-binding protein [Acidimicrobiales bacterium]